MAAAVFEECIVKELNGITRILVTNQLNLLNKCDHIAVIGSPSGEAAGTTKRRKEERRGVKNTLCAVCCVLCVDV